MAASLIKALWARLSGKKPAQGTRYFGANSRMANRLSCMTARANR